MVAPVKDDHHHRVGGGDESGDERNKSEKKELVANRKEFRIEKNSGRLRIIGNGNRIIVKTNTGALDIIGNAIRVKILCNSGKISFVGNNAKIYVGKDSPNTKIQCSGNDIKFKLVPAEQLLCAFEKRPRTDEEKTARQSTKHQTYCGSTTHNAQVFADYKNNISMPNLDVLASLDLSSIVRLSSSTGNIFIANTCNL